jgi:hypothetical protein
MIVNAVFTLSNTTQTKVVAASTLPQEVHLHNMTKSSNNYIHIGGAGVTLLNSLHLDPGESKVIQLMPNDDLWAVSNPNGLVLGVLAVRQD